jgi:hypothetical protein
MYSLVDQQLLLGCRLDRVSEKFRYLYDGPVFKPSQIIQAIGLRKASPMSEEIWVSSPWHELTRGPTHEVLDLMVHIPSVMEDADVLRQPSDVFVTVEKATALAAKCRQLATELERWHEIQEKNSAGPRSWEEPSILQSRSSGMFPDERGFPIKHRLCFSDLTVAHSEMLYWTSLLLLYSTHSMACRWLKETLGTVYDVLPSADDAFSHPQHVSLQPASRSCALNIGKSLEFFIRPEMGGAIIGLIAFPMSVAMGYFEYCHEPELAWFWTVLRYVRVKYAIPLDSFLESMFTEEILKLIRQ